MIVVKCVVWLTITTSTCI